ncbi:UvrD-helicase domain-containing protein [Phaeocystidibacter marisrubri]|uniref:ATP-dependent helicase n=1 Tax=Phaeocystidibacter marisrubri TaxID=1577780 RepID=A0A6L3ZK67_9FLAO|nr:UvrD-helicase domain-containing protein [Phaeocystidibacter marisrubri]KAB2818083.1 ATP-dependent helicase [Phaeocystidibacter marisrubri]GGH72034.1 hypothetical protein GCM10011318_15600 [Phaeocystidibacter marisrubri]
MQFTTEQKNIFDFVENQSGHGIIDAVAGAGKTTTIMECAKFVKDKRKILFCAFNNSISNDIAQKFHNLGLNEVTVKTIHALGRQIIQDNNNTGQPIKLIQSKYRDILKSPEIIDQLEPIYKKLLEINDIEFDEFDDKKNFAANNLIYSINTRLIEINQKYRSTLSKDNLSEFISLVTHFGIFNEIELTKENFNLEIQCYFEAHRIVLQAGNSLSERSMIIDFTDMLYLPYEWKLQPNNKFEFLFIDECQDLSKSQFAVAAKYGHREGRILAVGDPSQSIYGFTGADIESFQRVKDFTKAKQLPLTTCFRCPKKVIELAKTIRTDISGSKQEEGTVTSIHFEDVVKLAKPGDLIISRLRSPIIILVFSFIDKNIKVQIHQDEVTEIINEIKNIFKVEELNIVISTLPNGFEQLKQSVTRRWNYIIEKNAQRIMDSTERKIYIETEHDYLNTKLTFLSKKYIQWKSQCETMNDILKVIKEYISDSANPIKLSTIHRAKGLENERVFIINYDELPYFRIQQKDWEKTQEVNLKYVAITRALNDLFLIESEMIETMEIEESLFDNLPFD